MSALSAAKTVLEADSTLLATATGGVWDWDETGRAGINRTSTPAAFDSDGLIKPCVLLKLRSSIPDDFVTDEATQKVSYRQMIECWLYADPDYSAIETMSSRIYTLLHCKRLSGPFFFRWAGDIQGPRDLNLDAWVTRCDYQVNAIRTGA